MKKMMNPKSLLVVLATMVVSMAACSDRHELIAYNDLPVIAQAFTQKFFNFSDIAHIERERDGVHRTYKIFLRNATEIEFDYQGNLKEVDCQISPMPEGIVPEPIVQYVIAHFPEHFITRYEIGSRHLEIELGNGLELIFDLEGKFLRVDD